MLDSIQKMYIVISPKEKIKLFNGDKGKMQAIRKQCFHIGCRPSLQAKVHPKNTVEKTPGNSNHIAIWRRP